MEVVDSLNAVMALDALIKGSLAPAHGYWLLISIGGSLSVIVLKALVPYLAAKLRDIG